ncbi:MAG: hypothetical protein ABI442_21635 [Gemmatimonadaceae bacterium]
MKKAIGGMFLNSTVDTLMLFDGRDPNAEAKFSAKLHGGDGIKRAGAAAVLTVPPSFRGPSTGIKFALRQLSNAEGERKYPLDALLMMPAPTSDPPDGVRFSWDTFSVVLYSA